MARPPSSAVTPAVRRCAGTATLALVLIAGCAPEPKEEVPAPVAAVRAFLAAVHDEDCDTAWEHFSKMAQLQIVDESAEQRERPSGDSESFAPRRLYCAPTYANRYHAYVPETARLKSQSGKRAIVSVEMHEGTDFLVPGFWPTDTKITLVDMRLVEEDGRWTIVLP